MASDANRARQAAPDVASKCDLAGCGSASKDNVAQTIGQAADEPKEIAEANQAYGELTAHLHIAGYTLERAFQRLESLIAGDAWTKVGPGYTDINVFMDGIRLDQFKALASDRQRIVKCIRELQPEVSNRQIARTLGVDETTIRRDAAANAAEGPKEPKENKARESSGAANAAPTLTGAEAAKRVNRFEEAPGKRAARRAEILRGIADDNPPLPTGSRYAVIYADPPWRWETWSRETGLDRAPEAHYPTMELEAIKALDVPSLAAKDCACSCGRQPRSCRRLSRSWRRGASSTRRISSGPRTAPGRGTGCAAVTSFC